MDSFFVSCEIASRPYLKNKPVVVCTGYKNKSVVASASYTARKYGIHSGMPFYLAKALYPDIICIEANISKYASISEEIMNSLNLFSPHVEVSSIDEAYLDISYFKKNPIDLAEKIKKHIREHFKLPSTIGIGKSRIVAKAVCKKSKPDGIGMVKDEDTIKFMAELDIDDIPGIGEKTAQILKKYNIFKGKDLQSIPVETLTKLVGIRGVWFKKMSYGIDAGYFEPEDFEVIKSIGHSETLQEATKNVELLKSYLLYLSIKVFRRAHRMNKMGLGIAIEVKFHDFTRVSKRHTFTHPIFTYEEIYQHAVWVFNKIQIHKPVRLIGVTLYNIIPRYHTSSIFQRKDISDTLMSLYDKYGDFSLVPLSILTLNKRSKSIPPRIR